MDARFTAEQEEIRRTVREVLAARCGPEDVRAAVRTDAGYDPALWATLAKQLGLPGLALPEDYGCTITELALASEEVGRGPAPSPLRRRAIGPAVGRCGADASFRSSPDAPPAGTHRSPASPRRLSG